MFHRISVALQAHASGKIPKTRDRRDGQPTDAEVLVARAVDRVLRPLFLPGYCFDTQVMMDRAQAWNSFVEAYKVECTQNVDGREY